ncbi:hypothetical protein P7K49_025536, partial [Saguinus oedipus]
MLYLEDYLESECAALAGAAGGTCGRARARVDGQRDGGEGGGGGGCFFLTVTGSLVVGCRPPRPPLTHTRSDLPMDLRDRFTEMREMDLQVQNAMDQLEQRVSEFFMNAKKNKPEWREEQMASIKKDYYKALEDADEKVQLANQIYDL